MTVEPDVMDQQWCCLTCAWKGRWGEIIARSSGLHCPICNSLDLHPADVTEHEVDYQGPVPERFS